MNLRNYDNCVTATQLVHKGGNMVSQGDHTSYGDNQLTYKTTNGTLYKFSNYGTSNYSATSCCFAERGNADYGLVCGSGETAVTYDDYKLESQFSSTDISFVSCSYSDLTYDEATNTFQRTLTKVFTAKNNITIREIGFISYGFWGTGTNYNDNSGSYNYALTYRKVLDEPIEVAANSNFTLTFTTIVSACANKPAEYNASVTTE